MFAHEVACPLAIAPIKSVDNHQVLADRVNDTIRSMKPLRIEEHAQPVLPTHVFQNVSIARASRELFMEIGV